ncbi:hypothetical protein ABFU82_08030 [Nocardioides sp. WV_118_6]|uniref:hypothetical protein n=1 Tax=Nocardioides simplex TaxID=2045 RepID=UPI0021505A3A|nr:hypothetical protein [Pimelobacter simplex]UUW88419.1 hypothetical protein M0M43_22115 [Pimelobacter simplex]UUW97923.1 hypothetical protein M0M48_10760 [Pimelobacter simplex]
MRKLLFGGVAAVVAATLVPVSGTADGARAVENEATADNVVGTVLTDIGGVLQAVAGAEVKIWWVPDELSGDIGADLPVQSIGTVLTSSDGSYTLPLKSTVQMQQAARANGGYLNLEIGVVSDQLGKLESTTVVRKLNALGQWALPDLGNDDTDIDGTGDPNDPEGGDDAPDALVAPSSADPEVENPQAQPDFVLSADSPDTPDDAATSSSRAGLAAETPVYTPCSYVVDARPVRTVNVIEFHNASNSDARWTYGESADSDIEGAIDYAGDGGWSIHGSRHVGNSDSASVYRSYSGGKKANNFGTTTFKFIEGHYKPLGLGKWCEGTTIPPNTKTKNAGTWYGGVGSNNGPGSEFIGCLKKPQSDHRNSIAKFGGFTRSTKRAAKITGAVNVGPIKVGAQSGFSANLDVRWDALRGPIWLCGTNYEPKTAGVIHAQNK